jgi:hypothetical protein
MARTYDVSTAVKDGELIPAAIADGMQYAIAHVTTLNFYFNVGDEMPLDPLSEQAEQAQDEAVRRMLVERIILHKAGVQNLAVAVIQKNYVPTYRATCISTGPMLMPPAPRTGRSLS